MTAPLKHADLGSLDARPILFVHGFPLSGEMWLKAAERLDEGHPGAFRSIIPDLPGFGRSPVEQGATLASFADHLARLLDHLEIDRPAAVVGLSMGGAIALEFFARHRDRLDALGLIDCRAEADTPEKAAEREQLAKDVLERGSAVAAEALGGVAFHAQAPETLTGSWTERMAAQDPAGVAAGSRALASRADHTATLATIDVPTLVVVGDGDRITPPDSMRAMAGAIPGARLVVIERAGHVPPVEQPGAFAAALGGFLRTEGSE